MKGLYSSYIQEFSWSLPFRGGSEVAQGAWGPSGGVSGESLHAVVLAHPSAVKDAKEEFQEDVTNLAALMWLVSIKGNRHQKTRAILFSHDLNKNLLAPLI